MLKFSEKFRSDRIIVSLKSLTAEIVNEIEGVTLLKSWEAAAAWEASWTKASVDLGSYPHLASSL